MKTGGHLEEHQVELIRQGWLLQDEIAQYFPLNFSGNHRAYLDALQKAVERVVGSEGLARALRRYHLDWLTVHYRSIHPLQEWEAPTATPWLAAGMPLSHDLRPWRETLAVYPRSQSPYIDKLKESLVKQAEPVRIILHQEDELSPHLSREWLPVRERLAVYLSKITRGTRSQGSLSAAELQQCKKLDPEGVAQIIARFERWAKEKLSEREALGLFRDSCRVTFLGLRQDVKAFHYPRVIILAPAYLGENPFGGMAFIGSPPDLEMVPGRLDTFLLASLAVNVLSGLRLREKKEAQGQRDEAAKIAALNMAREEAVQRIVHTLQNPLESLEARARRVTSLFANAATELGGLQAETNGLRSAAKKLTLTFSSRNLAEVLAPKISSFSLKRLLENLRFVNETLFVDKRFKFRLEGIERDHKVTLDEEMLFEVLDNLLKNAIRYTRSYVALEVRFNPKDSSRLQIRVADDGKGIAPHLSGHLFQPGVSDQGGGYGFGLYYSRELMRRLGGDLTLERTSDDGTVFLVDLPRPEGT